MITNQLIKQELLQYTARLIETHPLQADKESRAARHDVAAYLVQQALELSETEEGHHDLFIAKPLLKATLILVKDRLALLKQQEQTLILEGLIKDYTCLVETLERFLKQLDTKSPQK